tara:strand:- start:358 stop:1101 length:744 start_codon:yes stop_codon:yes gene_type:complete
MEKTLFKDNFNTKGFVIVEKFVDINFIKQILYEINNSNNVDIYYDRNNKIRRIERIYDKGVFLKELNIRFINLIKNLLDYKVTIFKDKFNAKPPGGEGFSAHYDGIFKFSDKNGEEKNGWYHYGDFFLNVLLALDNCSEENGTIEIANSHSGNFNELLKKTTNDGTPNLLATEEVKNQFEKVNLNKGDLVIFKNTCPHRSDKNNSKSERRILYYTYSNIENGSKYKNYFNDKKNSKNETKKSLTGKL